MPLVNLKDRAHRGEGFRVPLSARAVEISREMERGRVSAFVFPGQKPFKPLSNMAMLTLLKRVNAGERSGSTRRAGSRLRHTASGQPLKRGPKKSRLFRTPSSSKRWAIKLGLKWSALIGAPTCSTTAASLWTHGPVTVSPERQWNGYDDTAGKISV